MTSTIIFRILSIFLNIDHFKKTLWAGICIGVQKDTRTIQKQRNHFAFAMQMHKFCGKIKYMVFELILK